MSRQYPSRDTLGHVRGSKCIRWDPAPTKTKALQHSRTTEARTTWPDQTSISTITTKDRETIPVNSDKYHLQQERSNQANGRRTAHTQQILTTSQEITSKTLLLLWCCTTRVNHTTIAPTSMSKTSSHPKYSRDRLSTQDSENQWNITDCG